jgi:transposase
MPLRQRQRRTKEDESSQLTAPPLEVFDTVGKPLPTSSDAGVPIEQISLAWPVAGSRPSTGALISALSGQFDEHHAELARILLDQIDGLSSQIGSSPPGSGN